MVLPGGGYQGSTFGTAQGNVLIPEIWRDEIKRRRDQMFVVKPSARMIGMQGKKGDVIH